MQQKVRNPSKKNKWIRRILALVILVLSGAIGYELWAKPYVMGYVIQTNTVTDLPTKRAVNNGDKDIVYGDDNTAVSSVSELLAHKNGMGTLITRGSISIPVQNGVQTPIQTQIYEGSSNYVLAYGAGTIKPNQKIGSGNYAIGAHNVADNRTLFSPLQTQIDVSKRPIAYVTDGDRTYKYTLNSWQRLSRTTKGLIADQEKHKQTPQLTLITCYLEYPNFYDALDRVVVTGELIGVS